MTHPERWTARALLALPALAAGGWLVAAGPPRALLVVAALAAALAAFELARLRGADRPWAVIATGLAAGLVLAMPALGAVSTTLPDGGGTARALPAMLVALGALGVMPPRASGVAAALGAALYCGGGMAALAPLRAGPDGASWSLLALVVTWVGDVGGFVAGRALGRRPLAPRWSPRKTVEGAVGSAALALAGAALLAAVLEPAVATARWLAAAFAGNLLGQGGDLLESRIKRLAGARHSSPLLGAQGGVLDGVDGLLLVLPFLLLLG